MSRHAFQELKDQLKNRSAGAFIDAFYYIRDNPSSTHRHRPTICVTCVFQRVPEGSSWTRSSLVLTPAQRLRELEMVPNAPRLPIEMLLPAEQHRGWTPQMFANFLSRIADIPLQFLCFVIHRKLWPAVEVPAASNWCKVILQPQFWQNQWLFFETNNGRVADQPRVASKAYHYQRRNLSPFLPIQDFTEPVDGNPWSEDWHNWVRPPHLDPHLLTLLRALLLSDPNIVDAGYNENPGGVDIDFLNTPLSWNTIGAQGGSDLEFPHASQLRHLDPMRFENGLLICQSTWYIAPNYRKLSQNRFDQYWLDPQEHVQVPAYDVATNWEVWVEDFQQEWNDIFLHHSIFVRARSRYHEDFLGINPNVSGAITHRNEGVLSLVRSMYPNFIPPIFHPQRTRPISSRLMGRGVVVNNSPLTAPSGTAVMTNETIDNFTNPIYQATTNQSTSLSDYIFFHMLHNT